jgi:hypothetical protein
MCQVSLLKRTKTESCTVDSMISRINRLRGILYARGHAPRRREILEGEISELRRQLAILLALGLARRR